MPGVVLPCSEKGFYNYFAGIHANINTREMQNKVDQWIQPWCEYMFALLKQRILIFLVTDALYKAQQYLFGTWLPHHKLQTEAFCLEYYEMHTPKQRRWKYG